jgi:hypothetical protein
LGKIANNAHNETVSRGLTLTGVAGSIPGQWIRFSCTALQPEEFHSFTLTSAPHEVRHNATGSLGRFENKNIFFYFEKTL